MKRLVTPLLAAVVVLASPAIAEEHQHAAPAAQKPSPEFDRLKALAGEWEGTARQPGSDKTFVTRAVYRVVSAGSAVMLTTDPGTPHEMVTMFHRDGDAVLATHYCSAQNQPRMKLVPGGDAQRLSFEFMDGTNLRDYPGRMQAVSLVLVDGAHHRQEWTYRDGAKSEIMAFDLERKK